MMIKVSDLEAFCYSNDMNKAIIFDFDGTIANSFELFVKTLHQLLHKSELLSPEIIEDLRGKQIKEITAQLGIKPWQLPQFVVKGRRVISANYESVETFEGLPALIQELSMQGYELFILSTNGGVVIQRFLKKQNLDKYFRQIYADIGLTGKARSLTRLISRHRYSKSEALYIGDEIRDIEAAHKAGIKCISVSWGYSAPKSLEAHNPDYLVTIPGEILTILESESSKLIH
jgi:phosphoglycolate phosphatase